MVEPLIFLEITTVNAYSPNNSSGFVPLIFCMVLEGRSGTVYTVDLQNKPIHRPERNLRMFNSDGSGQYKINNILKLCQEGPEQYVQRKLIRA